MPWALMPTQLGASLPGLSGREIQEVTRASQTAVGQTDFDDTRKLQ